MISISFRLPSVSDINPHKWELITTPAKLTPEIIPFSKRLKSRSHWAVGRMKLMLKVSVTTAIRSPPHVAVNKKLYFPNPNKL